MSCKVEDANIKWNIPTEEGMSFVNRLLQEFLSPELQSLQQFMDGKKTLDRLTTHPTCPTSMLLFTRH